MRGPRKRVVVANPADGGFIYWLFKLYLFGGIVLLLLGLLSVPAVYVMVARASPPPPNLDRYRQEAELASVVTAPDGRILARLVEKQRDLVTMDEVPALLVKAFLAAEDRAFFQHGGVDFRGIARAALANLRAGGVRQGGSTITQQVAKSYLSPERTIQRKLKEVVLARRIEARHSKEDILYLYLNHIYLGANAYGVKAAARVYFGKRLAQLTVSEAAMLAGLARAPSRYSPRSNIKRATRRRDQVLRAMSDAGYLDAAGLKAATAEPIRLVGSRQDPMPWLAPHFAEHVRRTVLQAYGKKAAYTGGWRVETTVDLALNDLARRRALIAVRSLDKRQGWRGPLFRIRSNQEKKKFLQRVTEMYNTETLVTEQPYPMVVERVKSSRATGRIGSRKVEIRGELIRWAAAYSRVNAENERTVDSARSVLREGDVVWTMAPPRWLRRRAWGTPAEEVTSMALHQVPYVEGSMFHYDHQTGYTLSMIGGLDYDRSTFNRAVQACRQPGSTYKPIFYSLALDGSRYSMATILQDRPYEPEEGEEWNPQNVHGTLDGKVTMHMSLVRSLNLPSIELLIKVGAKATERWARRLGFTTPIHADKALALGASCVRTDELTRAFATFARGGTEQSPVYIRQILDRDGVVIEDHTAVSDPLLAEEHRLDRLWALSTYKPRRAIDERTAFLITKLLRDAVLHGIAARCRIVPAPTGGKGGTSSDTMDTWFVGMTSNWVATSWIGDDNYRRPLGAKEASYTTAIPMWANYMKRAVDGRPHRELPIRRPKGLRSASIDFLTGKKPGPDTHKSVTIYYKPGTYRPE